MNVSRKTRQAYSEIDEFLGLLNEEQRNKIPKKLRELFYSLAGEMCDEDLIEYLGEDKQNYNDARMQFEYSNVAAGMRIPGIKNMQIDNPTSKIDIKPTLMQILDIEDEFSIGASMFSKRDYTCINNGKVITNEYLFDGEWKVLTTEKIIEKNTLNENEKNKLDKYEENMYTELDISKSVVVKNLLKDNLIE